MTRLPLLALALFLAACGTAPEVPAEDLADAYAAALEARDPDRALMLLEAQAGSGDLQALALLAGVRERGYLVASSGSPAVHLPIRTWPWSGALARRRFEAALQDSVDTGSHDALFLLAAHKLDRRFVDGAWETPDAAGAREVYDRLVAERAAPFPLADLAQRLGEADDHLRHLRAAADAGHPSACVLHYWTTRPEGLPHFAEEIAREIDTISACLARGPAAAAPEEPYALRSLRNVVHERDRGSADAAALLDSLRALGLAERHPELLPHLAPDT